MCSPIASLLTVLMASALLSDVCVAQEGRQLFIDQCARCHGETGDGNGTETLDRPARSFQEGGFSFGDTELAIYRTITHGIPGSPMPSFGEGLSDDQRRAVAAYVRTLCPPREEVSEEDTELLVGNHPLLAKGLLSPVVAGARAYPRGLLLGTPDGLTFEYRADNLRLLAVRQGPFARRSDWTGRGGTPLEPLGKIIWLNEGGDPPALFFVGLPSTDQSPGSEPDLQPLHVVLTSVSTPDSGAHLASDLIDADGQLFGQVINAPRRLTTSFGSGFTRRWTVSLNDDSPNLVLVLPWTHEEGSFGGRLGLGHKMTEALGPQTAGLDALWHGGELRVLTWTKGATASSDFGRLTLAADSTDRPCTIAMHVLPLAKSPDDPAALARELLR